MLKYVTAGESHGKGLVSILEGIPAGLLINEDDINKELKRRQFGYGRGLRMKIEPDTVEILAGLYKSVTTGAPIAIFVKNKDFSIDKMPSILRPRPGHADLSGYLKYNCADIRPILERASARETASRVAVGAVCKQLLNKIGINVISHVVSVGDVHAENKNLSFENIKKKLFSSKLGCLDSSAEERMIKKIDQAMVKGDTLGGIFQTVAYGVIPGLGSCMDYNNRLDSVLAMHIMSIPAVKAISIGDGIESTKRFGSKAHDEIFYKKDRGYYRNTNFAGGIEGGMSNGGEVVINGYMKPIPTLSSPLSSVDVKTKKIAKASVERHDTCAVSSAGVVSEALVAFVLTKFSLEKFGGDSVSEFLNNFKNYKKQISRR